MNKPLGLWGIALMAVISSWGCIAADAPTSDVAPTASDVTATAQTPAVPKFSAADIDAVSMQYKKYLVSQSQHLKTYASQWQGGIISAEFATTYYSIFQLAGAFEQADSADKLGGDADDIQALILQIDAWHTMLTQQTLTLSQIITQLQQSLAKSPMQGTPWQGLLSDMTQLVNILTPVLNKVAPSTLLATQSHLIQWQKGDNPQIRQSLRSDLAHIAELLNPKL
ncbi:hypothetical protein [Celerinatantimonas sp. YJH-8]|uniref:hypothetical protein n=1 Tax=Celerinatantimonas sp. YJH-8 TaxID=3228714 RepID=UPI0038C7FEC7